VTTALTAPASQTPDFLKTGPKKLRLLATLDNGVSLVRRAHAR
jgi:hypothetical protein